MDGFDESSQEESKICDGRHFAARLCNFKWVHVNTNYEQMFPEFVFAQKTEAKVDSFKSTTRDFICLDNTSLYFVLFVINFRL